MKNNEVIDRDRIKQLSSSENFLQGGRDMSRLFQNHRMMMLSRDRKEF
jgi:hypothetical protein